MTVVTAAAARAVHLLVDDEQRIFADSLAATVLGDQAEPLIDYHRRHPTSTRTITPRPRSPRRWA